MCEAMWKSKDGAQTPIATMSEPAAQARLAFLEKRGRRGFIVKALKRRLEDFKPVIEVGAVDVAVLDSGMKSVADFVQLQRDAGKTMVDIASGMGISISTLRRRMAKYA